ncbi:hypothetical protein BX266_3320 [Streptomyces sp. TLI_171]|nr:hypothetical protein BX266_3320 [Streptomyces sp. TLI_171]
MAMSRVRTVAFYEVVRAKDAQNARMEQVEWPLALERLRPRPAGRRTFATDEDHFIGEVVSGGGRDHLLIGRLGGGDHQTVDLDHGHIEDLRLEGNRGFIDTTTVCFLEFGNVVGMMQGGQASPRASAIQRWMNACGMVNGDIELWPVISKSAWDKLQNAAAVHKVEFTFKPVPGILPPEGSGLAGFARHGRERYPDHRISMAIEMPRRGVGPVARARGERRLREDVQALMSDFGWLAEPNGVSRARALVTLDTPSGDLKDEPLDFLKHHITAKRRVLVRPEDSRPRHEAAIDAILDTAREHADDLRAAVSASV